MQIAQWRSETVAIFKKAGITSADLDARILLEEVLGKDHSYIHAHSDEELTKYEISTLNELRRRRENREPLAYVVGVREFYGIPFVVDASVLVPRPETERMVEYIVENAPKKCSLLEIGTGSGAIAIATKHNREDITVTATDVSELALNQAMKNAATNGVKVSFMVSDLFSDVDGIFDVVAANLPYVPVDARRQEEITFEPDLALYGGDDGLDLYRPFLENLSNHLKKDGFAIIECSPTQHASMQTLAHVAGFSFEPISEYIYVLTYL